MGDELVSQHGAVRLDFDQIDGDCRHFCLDDSSQGIGKGEVRLGELEIDVRVIGLSRIS